MNVCVCVCDDDTCIYVLALADMWFLQVFDQYLNFISLEENLFIARHQDKTDISYYGQ